MMEKKVAEILAMQAMKQPALPTPAPLDLVIFISMGLVYLLSLPLALVYFLYIALPRLQLKNKLMKNRINRQSNAIYFRKKYNKIE